MRSVILSDVEGVSEAVGPPVREVTPKARELATTESTTTREI
jgi:hypothetical protein